MTDGIGDLTYLNGETTKLKQDQPHKVLFHEVEETGAIELTVDTSAFIKNKAATKDKDEDYAGRFEELIYRAIRHNYQKAVHDQLLSFKAFLESLKARKRKAPKRKYHYPLFEIYVRDPRLGGPEADAPGENHTLMPYGYITEPGMYETSVTCPRMFEHYLRRQIRYLIQNHAPVVRVRNGLRILPIHFAIEAHALGETPKIEGLQELIKKIDVEQSNEIRLNFEVPKLGEIDEVAQTRKTETIAVPSLEFINQHFFVEEKSRLEICGRAAAKKGATKDSQLIRVILQKQVKLKVELLKREYEIKQLSLFNGDRVDYSLGRIGHYTKTSPADFQNFVIFTNYQMYVEEFVKYCLAQVLVRFACITMKEQLEQMVAGLNETKETPVVPSDTPKTVIEKGPIEIVVPTYNRTRDNGEANHRRRPFTAEHIAEEKLLLLTDEAHGKCSFKKEEGKVHISAADLNTCLKASLLKGFGGKEAFEQSAGEPGKSDEKVLSALATELFKYFLEGRSELGILGAKIPQMPAYHLTRTNSSGISMVNIGVGPSNAKTITDHVAVLRPHVFLMLGHCAGLRSTQKLGHYVLANGYLRADGVLNDHTRLDLPIPPINQIHSELVSAFNEITGSAYSSDSEHMISPLIRTGTVATTGDRNWELRYPDPNFQLERAKAVGADMESATIATNGFRYSVPYATFLCVSDRPLHGDLKLEGMADSFYRDAVAKHFRIAIGAMEQLRNKYRHDGVMTRKLRDRLQPPFQ